MAEVDAGNADKVSRLLETELARGTARKGFEIDGLVVAQATVAERWSDFEQPGYAPSG